MGDGERWTPYTGLLRSPSEAGAVPNIPDEIIAEIIAQWLDIQEAMTLADQLWRKNPRQAALALAFGWGSFAQAAARTREAMGEPNVRAPLDTITHLDAALVDLYDNKVDPMLAPTPEEKKVRPGHPGLSLSTALQRIDLPVAMELLMMARGPKLRPEQAAEEISAKLGGEPRSATLLHWWHRLKGGGETEDAKIFRAKIELTKRGVADRGRDAGAYLLLVETITARERGRSFR
jgi:hypothetical protein